MPRSPREINDQLSEARVLQLIRRALKGVTSSGTVHNLIQNMTATADPMAPVNRFGESDTHGHIRGSTWHDHAPWDPRVRRDSEGQAPIQRWGEIHQHGGLGASTHHHDDYRIRAHVDMASMQRFGPRNSGDIKTSTHTHGGAWWSIYDAHAIAAPIQAFGGGDDRHGTVSATTRTLPDAAGGGGGVTDEVAQQWVGATESAGLGVQRYRSGHADRTIGRDLHEDVRRFAL